MKTCLTRATEAARLGLFLSILFPGAAPVLGQVYTEPHGYVKVSVAAGTGSAKKTTLISLPLLEEATIGGQASGRITGISTNTVTCAEAGWTPGELSRASEPHLIEITSGAAQGRMLLISVDTPNTTDTLSIAEAELAVGGLAELGIVAGVEDGDTYKIRPVDTLGSFFGTPESSLVQGGTEPRLADTITLVTGGSSSTYFYNTATTPPRWSRVALGTPDASNVPIPPYAAIQYARIAPTPLEFFLTGKVPTGRRMASVKNSGTTLVSSHWPQDQTLADFGLNNVPGWRKAATARDADTVILVTGGGSATYFHDGGNWRRVSLGSPISDSVSVPTGTGAIVTRKGQIAGYSTYTSEQPYILD